MFCGMWNDIHQQQRRNKQKMSNFVLFGERGYFSSIHSYVLIFAINNFSKKTVKLDSVKMCQSLLGWM